MEKEEFNKNIREEAKKLREDKIRDLKARFNNLNDNEKGFLEYLEKHCDDCRTSEEVLRDNYYKIMDEFDYWMDLKPEYKNLATLWIIGTYYHNQFPTFPILFVNAMRGSGKSRFLNLSSSLAKHGLYVHSNLTEPVAFRTFGALFIDEFENVASKEKQTLRELLNSTYKKGSKVLRMKEVKGLNGKDYAVQEFEVYRPVCLANIWGMEEVLSDRCITLILEKSSDKSKTSLIENYETNESIKIIKNQFIQCSLCGLVYIKEWCTMWNEYVKYKTTLYTTNTNYTNYTTVYADYDKEPDFLKDIELTSFFAKLDNSEITGRNLELFLPLFFIAKMISNEILDYTIHTASELINDRKNEEELESLDVLLYNFISKLPTTLDFYSMRALTKEFKSFIDNNDEWLNEKWMGRALKRLNLIISKRRLNNGVEVIVNGTKAKEKILIFQKKVKGGDKEDEE